MNTQTIHKTTDSDKLSWQNLRKKIIKKYPQYKIIIDSNSNLFSKLDFSKKENQVKVINIIIEKQQQALEQIFTEEQVLQQKEQQKQIKKMVGIIAKQSNVKTIKQDELKKKEQNKGKQKNTITAPVQLQKKVSDKIEAWCTLDDTQSLIHDYQDGTQEQFYITQDVQTPQENEQIKSNQMPQSILTKKKKKQKKTQASLIKEKSVRFQENTSKNERNIKQTQNIKKEISSDEDADKNEHENEEFNQDDGQNENEDEENVQSDEDNDQDEDVDENVDDEDEDEESQNENEEEEEEEQEENEEEEEEEEEDDEEEEDADEDEEENQDDQEDDNEEDQNSDDENDLQNNEDDEKQKKLQRLKEKALKKKC